MDTPDLSPETWAAKVCNNVDDWEYDSPCTCCIETLRAHHNAVVEACQGVVRPIAIKHVNHMVNEIEQAILALRGKEASHET